MRALAALRMVWASAACDSACIMWFGCGGGDVGNVVREEAAGGRAALAVPRVVGGAGEARLAREEAKDGHVLSCLKSLMNERALRWFFGDE
jgi:hypothetical protein